MSRLLASVTSWMADSRAWAQTASNPAPPASEGAGTAIAAIVAVGGLLVVVGVGVKLLDLKHKRESESVLLQAQVSDALLRERSVARLRLTSTAHVPLWSGSPATLDVIGQVPTPELKDTVLRIVRDEVSRIRADVRIEDHLSVAPTMARAA
jgi:hypothetical protein